MNDKFYLKFSEEILQLINENSVSLNKILHEYELEYDLTQGVMPVEDNNSTKTKDICTVILASSVSLGLIILAISKLIKTIYRKPHKVLVCETKIIRDGNGVPILDKNGQTLTEITQRYELLEPGNTYDKNKIDFKINADNGIVLKFESINHDTKNH